MSAGDGGHQPDARAERLKAALRENLRRRKAQGRGRAAEPGGVRGADDAEGDFGPRGPDSDKTRL